MKLTIILSLILLFTMQVVAQQTKEIFYADPTIYAEGDTYYMTGTRGHSGGPSGFSVLESKDLKTWNSPAGSTNGVHMIMKKGNQAFGESGFGLHRYSELMKLIICRTRPTSKPY